MGTNNLGRVSFGIIGKSTELEIIPSNITVENWIKAREFTDEQYKSLIIGFIEKGKLQLYMAETMGGTIDSHYGLNYMHYNKISALYRETFGNGIVEVFDGIKVNKLTKEKTPAFKILELNVVG